MKEKLLLFIAVLLVLLFSYTAISKLIDMSGNLYAMHNQPFPRVLGTLLAWVLPFTEIITALLLVVNKTRLLGLLISACLMFVFTIYVLLILSGFFGHIPCSCGGVISLLGWKEHLWLNLFFLLLAVTGIRLTLLTHQHIHA